MAFKMLFVSIFTMAALQMEMYSAINIQINPATFNAGDHSRVRVTCRLDDAEAAIANVLLMKIARKGERAIVLLHKNSSLSYSAGNAQEFPSSGTIANHVGDSKLEMSIASPDPEDSGSYTCSVYYTNGFGSLRENKASGYLTVNDPEMNKLNNSIQALHDQLDRGKSQILNLATQVAESKSKVEDLEAITDKHAENIKDLTDKEKAVEKKVDDLKLDTNKKINAVAVKSHASVQELEDKIKELAAKTGSDSGKDEDSKQDKEQIGELQKTVQKQAQTIKELAKKIADFDSKMKKLQDEMKQKLDKLATNDNKDLKNDLLSVKEKTTKQTGQIEDLSEKATQNENEIGKLNNIAKALAKKVDDNKKQVENAKSSKTSVAFHVSTGLYNMYPVKDQPLVFNEVLLNKGLAFNLAGGTFTAPVKGVYAFNLYLQIPCYGCKIEVTLVHDTKVLARFTGGASKDNDQHAISALTYMSVGDKVKTMVTYIGKKNWSLGYMRKSAFTGFLVA